MDRPLLCMISVEDQKIKFANNGCSMGGGIIGWTTVLSGADGE